MNKCIPVILASVSLGGLAVFPAQSWSNDKIRKVGYGHLGARALHVAAYFKLFDTLQDGPKTAAEMSTPEQSADAVKRLMRTLANHQLVLMDENERFSLNDESRLLVSTADDSLQPAMAKEFDLNRWQAIGNIHQLLDKDIPAHEQVFGKSYYEYLTTNSEASQNFHKGMKNFSESEDTGVAEADLFKTHSNYCDIGGGTGGLVAKVLANNPKLKGILFDLPETISQSRVTHIKLAAGSFFNGETIPGADVYTVKRVLHNWKDPESVLILKNIRAKLSDLQKGRVLVIERVVPVTPDGSYLGDSDIIGMALGGKERTLAEFIEIGRQAGLELEEQRMLNTGVSILVFRSK